MRHHTPRQYTILVASTGQSPLTVSLRPTHVVLLVLSAVVLPILGAIATIYSLHQSNRALAQRNEDLTQSATEVLDELSVLDSEIKNLRERAGLPPVQQPRDHSEILPQGGIGIQLEAEDLLAAARSRIPGLKVRLNLQVKPALYETLDHEAARNSARPKGYPVKDITEISSKFGLRRNPFGQGHEFHNGIDFPGPQGALIHATAPGVVEVADWSGGYGYHVIINHGFGYQTLYAHLSKMVVNSGTIVEKDQVIGHLGSTGRSSGPHLHYTIYRDDEAVNPQHYLD